MAQSDDDADKSHEPTRHKLEEARKKGEIARSADLNTAAAYGGILVTAVAFGAASTERVSAALMVLIDQSDGLAPLFFDGPAAAPAAGLLLALVLGLAVWFVVPAACALLSVLAQKSLILAPSKLQPRISRVDPVQNAKNKYGPTGLFEFAKSFAKLLFYSLLLGAFLVYRFSDMAGAIHAEPVMVGALMARLMIEFMSVVLVISLVIGGVDYLWQHYDHLRRNRMSHRDVKEEHKQHEGDPHMKQERRQRGTRIATEQMMADVPDAEVVIVNPSHYAVALAWSRLPGSAPVCVAKGVDHLALAIRERAVEAGVPVRRDPATARALFATTTIGEEIAPDHYRAVAAAIRFAEAMRRKARALG
ncbi:EscU/YscU/HrcU family type III secretion system export apparatus switch protein [Roseovarius salis]|uniref:EscU/YscU/HrcU family type III secretion system export apparatus switch protein n=1 Tax=Roseovarius salis TaxID=3376063 RepID=UPI0037CAB616